MKILFITPIFSVGEAEKNMLNIINQIKSDEFDIHLIIWTNESDYLQQLNKKINIYIY